MLASNGLFHPVPSLSFGSSSRDSLLTSGFLSHGCRCTHRKRFFFKKIKQRYRLDRIQNGETSPPIKISGSSHHVSERNNIRGFTPPRLPHSLLPLPDKERQSSTSLSSCSVFELAAPADIFQLLAGGAVAHTHTQPHTDTLQRKQTHRNISAHTDLFTLRSLSGACSGDACLENVCAAGTVHTRERERQGYLAAS